MTNCTHCKHAEWGETVGGRLHPSGNGRCGYLYKLPVLPASMYWLEAPRPRGGHINRHKDLKDNCPHYEEHK